MSDMERVDRGDLKARSCSYRHCLSILPRVNSFRRKFNNMIYGSRLISRSPWTTLVVRGYVRILARQLVETPCTSAGRTLPLSCILRRPVGAADCTQAHRCGPGPQRHRFRVRARRMAGKSVLGVDGHYIDRNSLAHRFQRLLCCRSRRADRPGQTIRFGSEPRARSLRAPGFRWCILSGQSPVYLPGLVASV